MVRFRFGALVATAALALAACGPAASPSAPAATQPPASAPASAPPSAAIKEGGTIVVAIPGDIKRTDSALTDDSNSSYVFANVMEGLVGLKPGSINEIIPVLATELPKVSADKLSYTFTLRTGVKFHDGTDFNADAVKFNYDRWTGFPADLQDYSYYANTVLGQGAEGNVASVTADTPTQVTIKLKRPNTSFLLSQTLAQFGIASPAALKAGKADNSVKDITKIPYAQGGTPALVGTGPFKWEKWVKNSEVDIVKNPDYWDKDHIAHLDKVVFKPIADETAIVNGLQGGDIDIAQKVSPVDVESLKTDSRFTVIDRGDSCNLFHLGINQAYTEADALALGQKKPKAPATLGHTPAPATDKKILQDVKVRQAVMYAIDRQAIVDKFYAGQAKVADNWMPPATPFYKALSLPTYDVQKAKDLLTQTGLTPDQLTIDFWYPSDVTRPYLPDPKGIFEAIQGYLEAAGFKVRPHTATWSPTYLDDEYAGKYELWEIGWTCDWAGPDNFIKTAFFGYVNGKPSTEFGYKSDALDKAMNDALAASDDATAKSNWDKAQDELAKDLPSIPIANSTPPAVVQSFIKGFVGAGNITEYMNSVYSTK